MNYFDILLARKMAGSAPLPKIAGIEADFDALTVTRIADSASWQAGEDYDVINAFGLRRRCNVADDGTINAWWEDETYTEDGSNGQVMVYQPKFYYKVEPVETGTETLPNGATKTFIKKGRWYVSDVQHDGFKLHPLFKDKNGAEIDFVLKSAFEGALYDASENAYAPDLTETITFEEGDRLDSVSGQKPISGRSADLTKPNAETLANGHGADWHISTIQDVNAEQLLMIVELASFDMQTALEDGIVSYTPGTGNESAQTGSTKGNRSGHAASTLRIQSDGTQDTGTTGGYRSIYYRGVENFFGNIWKHVNGLNIWGDGNMHGGQAYICSDFNFDESKHDDNYEPTGLYFANASNYVKYFGYNSDFDWLFIPSAVDANSLVKDNLYVTLNLNGNHIARLGGHWYSGSSAGGFYWLATTGVGTRARHLGGRLLYVRTTGTRGLMKNARVVQKFEEAKDNFEKDIDTELEKELRQKCT